MKTSKTLILLLGLALSSNSLSAQQGDRIHGKIMLTEQAPVKNAILRLVNTSYQAKTNNLGEYYFENVPPGEYTLQVVLNDIELMRESIHIQKVLSRLLGVLYQGFILISGKTSISIRVPFHLDIPLLQKILKITFGGLVQYIIPTSSWLIMVKIISTFGTTALAGYIIAQRIASVATMPAWGIGNAAGVLTGQNLGAGEPDRAEKTVWRAGTINMTYLVMVALFWQIAAEYVVKFFTTEPEVARYAVQYIHVVSMAYLLLGFTMVISRALNAAGNILQVTLLYLVMFYVIQLPMAYLLGVRLHWELRGIFTAIVSSEIVLAVLFLMIFRNGKWKTIKI